MKKILIIGATSAIASAAARIWAEEGSHLYLIARDEERLKAITSDLLVRGAQNASYSVLDANDVGQHQNVINTAISILGGLDIVLIAHGTLGNQKACEHNFQITQHELHTNLISTLSFVTHLANVFEHQKHGALGVISSVAGDRGRQSNYVYGTAKGAISIFLQGVRQRLYPAGVRVLTIKPGFVDTPMTADFKKGPLWASASGVAQQIVKAFEKRNGEIYVPGFWRVIMAVIKFIPESLFNRLKL